MVAVSRGGLLSTDDAAHEKLTQSLPVREVVADSFAFSLGQWFNPSFEHPFLNISIVVVPNDVKPIPPKWVDDVEIDEFGAEMGDVMGEGPTLWWTPEERKMRLQAALKRLDLQSLLDGPQDEIQKKLKCMNATQLNHEKKRVKQELKKYDSDWRKQFKVVPNHSQKEAMRPLYVYYRCLKQQITQGGSGRSSGQPGQVDADSDDEDRQQAGAGNGNQESAASRGTARSGGDVEAQIAQLEARVNQLQQEKGSVRTKLREFQESFVRQHHRKIKFHKDILPIEREYRVYKNIKEEMAKVESQIRSLRVSPW
eukprot:TRINITY_DN33751_c0_g1_i1.p1 TRINITY_DN33751_c0_g1~~TRINITY_DN33751_c0_g1_i1.p1  ORF type:complete len:311 (-),score=75.98 TRINITY_DN33751_c0_g1_i1:34-966(-)